MEGRKGGRRIGDEEEKKRDTERKWRGWEYGERRWIRENGRRNEEVIVREEEWESVWRKEEEEEEEIIKEGMKM